jgi:hypothetical protein
VTIHRLVEGYTRSVEPARAGAAGTLKLERTLSDLANQAYGPAPAEIELMWKTAPLRHAHPAARNMISPAESQRGCGHRASSQAQAGVQRPPPSRVAQ